MRAAARRIITLIYLTLASLTWAQQAPAPQPRQGSNSNLGPATSPTRDEQADAVREPAGLTPLPTAAPVDPKTYEIGPEDILHIRVWREPELSSAVQVRPDGKITLPLVGELSASGRTPEQLKVSIVEKLTDFINKPEVMVSVQAVQSRRYYITGEVFRPGAFPLVVPTTILEALTNAGGFKEFANRKKITILRKGKTIRFNYNDVVKGKNLEQNIHVENGDYLFVP